MVGKKEKKFEAANRSLLRSIIPTFACNDWLLNVKRVKYEVPVDAMKTCMGVVVILHSLLTWTPDGVVMFMPQLPHPRGKISWYPKNWMVGGQQ